MSGATPGLQADGTRSWEQWPCHSLAVVPGRSFGTRDLVSTSVKRSCGSCCCQGQTKLNTHGEPSGNVRYRALLLWDLSPACSAHQTVGCSGPAAMLTLYFNSRAGAAGSS